MDRSGGRMPAGAQAAAQAGYPGGQVPGAYGQYSPQAAYGPGFPSSKPPTCPPPQPPASLASEQAAGNGPAVASSSRPAHLPAFSAQPPPPPLQAPHVPPVQSPLTQQGPPPTAPNMARPGEMSEEERRAEEMLFLTTPEAQKAAREKYGLLGILKVIKMTDPDLNTLALGMDLTTLGLNLNSPECLYQTFASPWSDIPARKDPEFYLPPCYYMNPPQLKTAHLQKFSNETLFYIFFNMPKDMLQSYAAAELYNRGWKYHRDIKAWFAVQDDEGQHRWVCFDSATWEKSYFMHPLDTAYFLTEDDVRVKNTPSTGGVQLTPGA